MAATLEVKPEWTFAQFTAEFSEIEYAKVVVDKTVAAHRSGPGLLAQNKQRALEWVNALRTEWGYAALDQLPQGITGNAGHCVLARALPNALAVDSNVRLKTGAIVRYPIEVGMFIRDFDQGLYPELIERCGGPYSVPIAPPTQPTWVFTATL